MLRTVPHRSELSRAVCYNESRLRYGRQEIQTDRHMFRMAQSYKKISIAVEKIGNSDPTAERAVSAMYLKFLFAIRNTEIPDTLVRFRIVAI